MKLLLGLLAVSMALKLGVMVRERLSPPSSPRFAEVQKRLHHTLQNECATRSLTLGAPLFIRIFKESKELELWLEEGPGRSFRLLKSYTVATWGSGTLGPKLREGDGQAPEGFYSVAAGQMNPNSTFHLSFNIGYPNAYDRAHECTGSFIMVHGDAASAGCFAMTNERIEEIYTLADAALRAGQRSFDVHIFPFRMTPQRLAGAEGSQWFDFWQNLEQGYQLFEKTKRPPLVQVRDMRYLFVEREILNR
ncbi:MAG: L,D-transpeptidase family protein [Verrucomicrobiales bacterium]